VSKHDHGGVLGTRHTAFGFGFLFAAGWLVASFLGSLILLIGSIIVLVVVSMFLAVGLDPAVNFFVHRGLKRHWGVLIVLSAVLTGVAIFIVALVPVITDQITAIVDNAPGWFDQLQGNQQIRDWDERWQLIDRAKDYISTGSWSSSVFGGVVGVSLAVLSALGNTFIVVVLTLYFVASLASIKQGIYRLAPASRRDRVSYLGEKIFASIGGYVSGAFIVALAAGVSSLIFLMVVGLAEYAVALALVVAILDVIPMIGATLGATVVTAIGFATDTKVGIACLIFYLVYQQIENYLIYPRVMSRSVDVPASVTVIAALVGAALLGVVGALLAIPTAAAILLVIREVFIPKQDAS
jgi:predicted PurR-regulated permease PerM